MGDFTVTVGYRKDVVRQPIRVQVREAQPDRRICGDILLQQGHGQKHNVYRYVKFPRVGDLTVTVGYRKYVRHTIRVQVSEA